MIDDLRYLMVFAKIAECGSLSAAAEALGMTPATVSQHLGRLEKRLETALLYRDTRKQTLTPAGQRLLGTARDMLALYESGMADFQHGRLRVNEPLRVSFPAIFINSPLVQTLASFIRAHPGIRLTLHCSDNRHDVIGDNIDLALRIGDMPDSALKCRYLFSFARQLVATPSLLAQQADLSHPRRLPVLPWIGLTMLPDEREFTHVTSGETCAIRYQTVVRVDNVQAAFELARQDIGLAAPPAFLSMPEISAGTLSHVLPEWSLPALKVYAVWPANIAHGSAVYQLIDWIQAAQVTDTMPSDQMLPRH